MSENSLSKWIDTMQHEVAHGLGFSFETLKSFPGVTAEETNGKTVLKGCDKAINFGKEYFKCDSMSGLPLENDGGEGSKNSHWERTTFGNEFMTASDMPNAIRSSFTFLTL